MRRLAGSVLVFEAIVIILAVPVAINVAGVDPAPAIAAGLGLAAAAVVLAARVDRPGGVAAGWILQGLVLASALIVPVMALLGAIFAALWYGALRLAAAVPVESPSAAADHPEASSAGEAGTAHPDEQEETP